MNLSHRIRSAALALSVLAAFSLPVALAQPDNAGGPAKTEKAGHHYGQKKHHGCGAMKQLNLSDQQREQMKASRESFKNAHQGDFEKMKARWQEMKQLQQDPKANQDKIAAIKAEMKLAREAHFAERKAELQKILTPEQFSQFESLRQQCKAQRPGGMGHGKRHGQKRQAPADTDKSTL